MTYVAKSEPIVMDKEIEIKYDKFISSTDNGLFGVYSTEKN
jgi:hypothetical protein